MIWHCTDFEFNTEMPIIMGILNVTPDSFSDGGQHNTLDAALIHAQHMVKQGAAIVDVGGESTRPGADPVALDEELRRTIPVIHQLVACGMCVSIDTRHEKVARAAVEAGAAIINDVSGFRDPAMRELAARTKVGVVIMHMQGKPATMQKAPHYNDVVGEVSEYLRNRAACLEAQGVDKQRICLDPGPGFGKTPQHTKELVRNFQEFVHLGYPIMVAVSRKGFLQTLYGIKDVQRRDQVSATEAVMAVELGASVVRTHNVKATIKAFENLRPRVVLGLGSNVPLVAEPGEEREGKIALLNQAIGSLCSLPDSQIVDVSSFYESEPAYFERQDVFVNAVVVMRTGLPPKELLGYLHAIENSLGRVRTVENGPRTIDIDIIDYQLYKAESAELTLPHPAALERDFVVKPLLEVLPHYVLANGKPVTYNDVLVGAATKL